MKKSSKYSIWIIGLLLVGILGFAFGFFWMSPLLASHKGNITRIFQKHEKFYAPVLMYHHVAPKLSDSPYYVSPDIFEEQMAWLKNHNYQVIPYSIFFQALEGTIKLPPRSVVLTFDDADLDHYTNAFRIMKKYGYTGTFFVPVNFIGEKDRLTWPMLQEMVAAGMDIESHSMTHPDMARLTRSSLDYELVESKKFLEEKLGIKVNYFAYPGGAYLQMVLDETAKAGYFSAVTTNHSVYHEVGIDPFLVSRMHIDSDMESFVGFVTGTRKN